MKKLLHQALSLNYLNKIFGFETLWQAMKSDLRLKVLSNPQDLLPPTTDKLKILVLSPHPDDDAFALGGTIYKLARAGEEVTVLYLCDGSKGTRQGIRDSSLIIRRKKEAQEAGKILGINELIFWRFSDGRLEANRTSIKALSSLIEEIMPDMVILPSFLDDHPDHKATNAIFYGSIFGNKFASTFIPPSICMYELWTPIFPNRIIDITDVIEKKKQAVICHQSQLKSRRYDEAVLALNKYRAEINGIKGSAEAFFISTVKAYKKLYELIK